MFNTYILCVESSNKKIEHNCTSYNTLEDALNSIPYNVERYMIYPKYVKPVSETSSSVSPPPK